MSTNSLDVFTRPKSVAVIGASEDPARIGGRPLSYLIRSGYAGGIYPINPSREQVQGRRAYANIRDVPTRVDCAMIAVPRDKVAEAVMQAIEAGVKGIVIFTAGFAETGSEGAAQQSALMAAARVAGVRILGPNCLGTFCTRSNVYLTFSGVFEDAVGTAGTYGFISQSGGFAGEIVKMAATRAVHFGTWFTTGNEADVELGEALYEMACDDSIETIAAFVEGVRNGSSFLRGLEAARHNKKPFIVLKAGRTEAGAAAVRSHTASLAGADDVYSAVFHQYAVHRANSIQEMLDVMCATRRKIYPAGRRLGIVTTSGGNGALAADFAAEFRFELPMPSDGATLDILALSENAATSNPIDLTAKVANDPSILARSIEILLSSGQYDSFYVFVGLVAGMPALKERIWQVMKDLPAKYPSIPLVLSITAPPDVVKLYESAEYILIQDPARAIRALDALARFGAAFASSAQTAPNLKRADAHCKLEIGKTYNEVESKAILKSIGVPSLRETFVPDAAEAEVVADAIGGNLALKVVSGDVLHKTDAGGVMLNVPSSQITQAVRELARAVRQAMPQARIDGYLISPMVGEAPQFFVGVRIDPVFGPVLVVGAGGITVELIHDVSCHLAPVNREQALGMLKRLKCFALLNGYRRRPVADIEALVQAMISISDFACAQATRLKTLEVNPIAVLPAGQGVVALDAVIETESIVPVDCEFIRSKPCARATASHSL